MKYYYDEGDYPLPKIEPPVMLEGIYLSSTVGYHVLIAYDSSILTLKQLLKSWTNGYNIPLPFGQRVYTRSNELRVAFPDMAECSLSGAKISAAYKMRKIWTMTAKEILEEYGNIE